MRKIMTSLLLLPLFALPAWADDDGHDRARQALRDGKVLPLARIIERVGQEQPGDVLEVELEEKRGVLVYEVKVIDPAGQVIEVLLDAGSGDIIGRKGKHK